MANASPAWADLIGTSVSGSAKFTSGNNLFDPAFGIVPAGLFGNSPPNGPNNVIIGPEIEFGLVDPFANTDTADFTGTQVTLKDVNSPGVGQAVGVFSLHRVWWGQHKFGIQYLL